MDKDGKAVFVINDLGMYRGAVSSDAPTPRTGIFAGEELK
jgi:beta-aspartyl-peptidase (threonine type)